MPDVIAPTIHINGSDRADMLRVYREADRGLKAALDALAGTYPNGRDYYPQGDGAIRVAMAEHNSRVKRLTAVRAEIVAILEVVDG